MVAFHPYRENCSLCPPTDLRNTSCTLPDTCLLHRLLPPAAQRLLECYTTLMKWKWSSPNGGPFILSFFISPPHLFLCSDPLGVCSFFETLHADCVEFHHALSKRDEVQDVSKCLQECNSRMSNNLIKNRTDALCCGTKTLNGQL